jgi:hypothetical protein
MSARQASKDLSAKRPKYVDKKEPTCSVFTELPRETVLKVPMEHELRPCESTKRGKWLYLVVLCGQKARSKRCFDPF